MPLYFWEEEKKRRYSAPVMGGRHVVGEVYDPKQYLGKVALTDSQGVELPPWKRLIIAKQLAEKKKKEDDERKALEEQESRFRDMPVWKRSIIEKRDSESFDSETEPTEKKDDEQAEYATIEQLNSTIDQVESGLRAQSLSPPPPPVDGRPPGTVRGSSVPSRKSKYPAPPPPTHDEDGLPLAPWQIEMNKMKQSKTPQDIPEPGVISLGMIA